MSIADLEKYLADAEEGPIPDVDTLAGLLAACWHELAGSRETRMSIRKLLGRIASAEWRRPVIDFIIQRYGGTALGSSRAELQRWSVDVAARTAAWSSAGRRQVRPTQMRLNVRSLADELAHLVASRAGSGVEMVARWKSDSADRESAARRLRCETDPFGQAGTVARSTRAKAR
jgi:hypothetical protein